jgi:hypothetical protein
VAGFFVMPADGSRYVKGEPKTFTRTDLEKPATRQFCAECGTHIASFRSGPIILLAHGGLHRAAMRLVERVNFSHVIPSAGRASLLQAGWLIYRHAGRPFPGAMRVPWLIQIMFEMRKRR